MEEQRKILPKQPRGKLTKYKLALINEYLKDYDGTKALLRIGYRGGGVSQRAYYLLHLPEVQEEIARQEDMILQRVGVHRTSVLSQLARIGYADLRKLYNEDGSLKNPKDIDDDTIAAVGGIEVLEEWGGRGEERKKIGETKKVRLRNSVEALKVLAKHLKLTGEDVEGGQKVQIQILVKGRDVEIETE